MGKPGKKAGAGMQPPTKTDRQVDAGKTHLRDQRTVRRLKMYTSKVTRNEKGEIVKGSVLSASDRVEQSMARIAPDRRWFGNTRTIGQEALQEFREEMGKRYHDPYSVIVRQGKLPLSLLQEPKNKHLEPKQEMRWSETFGDKAKRKRVKLGALSNVEQLATAAADKQETYAAPNKRRVDRNLVVSDADGSRQDATNNRKLFKKGQSTRIWNELHKVIDSADVVLYVLDARDPMGTRSAFVEEYMRTEKKYKHFVFVLNKCDLVPLWVTARWLQILSKDFPTVAFHASVNHPFGKGSLISLLRQFSRLHNVTHRGNKRTKAPISVGVIGYPNAGKSSVINTLRRKSVCKTAPIPGETKVWQYVALTRSIFLIDCPGIVYDREGNDDTNAVLKGVVRVERLGAADKTDVVHSVFDYVKAKDLAATYGIPSWEGPIDFLEQLAVKRGKLLQGGTPDVDIVARSVLYDWQRGKLPWYKEPPFDSQRQKQELRERDADEHLKRIEGFNTLNVVDDRIEYGSEAREDPGAEGPAEDAQSGGDSDDAEAQEAEAPPADAARRSKAKKTAGGRAGKKAPADATATNLPFETLATAVTAREEKQKRVGKAEKSRKSAAENKAEDDTARRVEEAAWESFMSAGNK
uniref:Nucleolar GTP-binding protein 2 n=1 Tax=Neobodo designis TaxID=312471 RepID=A0A7S1Q8W1_NEODS|eukprot:CAMPEP_0174851640 /NCGR_PEP_ID=MMETSP1114-20130205/23295_1 /TAXON_ID=312471 /ORGANISM="Neobodo designis, Strain CCAP 1951/1" /LENGTH=635 /DNA_ID=CAMNT_0016086187 /DNA_START=36 /DNA_END=1943 /DNA_ORIENTATION=-